MKYQIVLIQVTIPITENIYLQLMILGAISMLLGWH